MKAIHQLLAFNNKEIYRVLAVNMKAFTVFRLLIIKTPFVSTFGNKINYVMAFTNKCIHHVLTCNHESIDYAYS